MRRLAGARSICLGAYGTAVLGKSRRITQMDNNGKFFISMYHYARDLKHSRYPGIKGLDVGLFRKQMEFFKDNCNVVRMEQVIEATKVRERPLPHTSCWT